MKRQHNDTLRLLFKRPVSANVKWREAISLLEALGAEIEERSGSRVAIVLKGKILHQHRPHPSPDMDKGAVAAMRDFLTGLGIKPDGEKNEHD